jgi:hypothetical protein
VPTERDEHLSHTMGVPKSQVRRYTHIYFLTGNLYRTCRLGAASIIFGATCRPGGRKMPAVSKAFACYLSPICDFSPFSVISPACALTTQPVTHTEWQWLKYVHHGWARESVMASCPVPYRLQMMLHNTTRLSQIRGSLSATANSGDSHMVQRFSTLVCLIRRFFFGAPSPVRGYPHRRRQTHPSRVDG